MFKIIHWMVVSRSQLLVDLLDSRWPQEFLVKLSGVEPDKLADTMLDKPFSMVIIDLASVDMQRAYQLQRYLEREHRGVQVVYIHFPKKIEANFLLDNSSTIGVFLHNTSIDELGLGLVEVLKGNQVIPQCLIDARLRHEEQDDSDQLTIREREVLQALLTGSTNLDIANQLFVSESTIKTHLYRAFRKIGVSSRGQAIAWAQVNLHEVQQ